MRSRKELANTLRILALDAVEAAQSGHPGAPMGMADMAEALWRGAFRHNPANPQWPNRDRFVLSNGHASMLLYGLLHLTGYNLSIEDIKAFRQLDSKTPGHPEYGCVGVETSTGPLALGFAEAVGMALAEKVLAAEFNRENFPIVNHNTYVFVGDGCLMEGLSQEACSLAGTLGLGKLIVLYDDNGISIDGKVKKWFADDTPARFSACGWHVIRDIDGHDGETLDAALTLARTVTDKPSLICCRTIIGYGSPNKSGSAACHGSPIGEQEATATRILLGWESDPFVIPEDISEAWDARKAGAQNEAAWRDLFERYRAQWPDQAAAFEKRMSGDLPEQWPALIDSIIHNFDEKQNKQASRVASLEVLNHIAPVLPGLFGGSADLSGSVGTRHGSAVNVEPDQFNGNYLHYGVREFLMGAMLNGLALHGGFIPYGGTFLVFSDYTRAAIRLSAMMGQRVVWLFSHDSIGVGEDGPTHQPVEQIASLRLIPGLLVWRPCDGLETAVAWKNALEIRNQPSCLILSRQGMPAFTRSKDQLADVSKGGYVLRDCAGHPEAVLLATGSEVALAVSAAEQLEKSGRQVRVVSMPCPTLFDAQSPAYRESVLPASVRARVAVEAASADFWWKYVGLDGAVVGMTTFGASAPAAKLFEKFGFTADNVAKTVQSVLSNTL